MEGSKIKNIVILILLLLNAFLLLLVGGRWYEDEHSAEVARQSAIQIIRDSGVELAEEAVPGEMALRPVEAARDLARESELAARLLNGTVTVEARGGEVYRYSNASGTVQFHSTGEFWAEFEPGAFPLDGRTAQEHGAQVLDRLGMDVQLLEQVQTGELESVTFRQLLDGAPVLDCQATLNYRDGELASITDARWVIGPAQPGSQEGAVTVTTALMRLYNGLKDLGDIYNRIESITPAYTMSISLSGPARLTPVWYVQTDTGRYQLDPQAGTLARRSTAGTAAVMDVMTEELP